MAKIALPDYFSDSLGHNLHRIGQLMREETSKALKRFGVTPEQWELLIVLSHTEGLTPTELGEYSLRDKTTISRMLPALLRKGMIEKKQHPRDARSYVVTVSEAHRQKLDEMLWAVKEHFEQQVFVHLSQSEYDSMLGLIGKLRRELGDL
jgi:DNA-binding MarR family transcriptional regulator